MSRKNKISQLCIAVVFIMAGIASLLYFSGAYMSIFPISKSSEIEDNSKENINKEQGEKDDTKEQTVKEKSEEDIINEKAEEILGSMALEEKVGQLFIVDFEALNGGQTSTEFNDVIQNTLKKYHVGGVIYFANNLVTREQTIKLNEELQKNSSIPMFISVDEEGGTVSRIADNENMGTTKFTSMRKIGDSRDVNKAYEVGFTIGKEINELGFNLDFAPDADVITNPNNTEIGSRSFGTDANIVSEMVPQVVKGLHENNVCAALKHFPGHGGSEANSHNEFSYTPQNLEGLRQVEFLPFKAGMKEDADFILVSHIAAPNVTGDNTPCSLSSTIITDILRNELEYDNVVITDALNMKAVSNYYTPKESSIAALKAGADMLLMPVSIDEAYNSVISACNNGTISEERLNQSVKRILKVKIKRGIIK